MSAVFACRLATVRAVAPLIVTGLLVGALATSSVQGQPASPDRQPRLPGIDRAVEAAITAGQTPGAVVLVGRGSRVLHVQAYGARATTPVREPMTIDTVFDLASLTKVVATTTAAFRPSTLSANSL